MTGTRTSRLALAAASAAFLFAACTSVSAEPAKPAPAAAPAWKGKNLQVFAPDTPRDTVIAAMKNFSTALGVECSFCHVNGADGKLDPASDIKTEKAAARWMMKMVQQLNQDQFKVTDWKNPKVTCYTCHRGAAHPLTAPVEKPAEPKL